MTRRELAKTALLGLGARYIDAAETKTPAATAYVADFILKTRLNEAEAADASRAHG